ncbi:MAG: hypothetical protein ACFE0P_10460 [Oceanicaulis sp.]
MILSNISKAIREQNWFAVVLEFVIVIAGVVIGFQINAWNKARAERALGQTYKTLIVGEIERQRADYQNMVSGSSSILQDVRIVAAAIDDPESVRADPDHFISAIWYSRYRGYRDTQRTVYDGMESSGRIALIDDEGAVQEIRTFYRMVARSDAILINDWNPWSRYNIALEGYLTADEIDAIMTARASGAPHQLFTADEAVALAVRMRDDPEVVRLVRSITTHHYSVRSVAESALVEANAVLANLGAPPPETTP